MLLKRFFFFFFALTKKKFHMHPVINLSEIDAFSFFAYFRLDEGGNAVTLDIWRRYERIEATLTVIDNLRVWGGLFVLRGVILHYNPPRFGWEGLITPLKLAEKTHFFRKKWITPLKSRQFVRRTCTFSKKISIIHLNLLLSPRNK